MEGSSGELQCIGKLEIAKPKPVGFLCGSLPVPTDSTFPLFQSSALLPSSPHATGAPRYQMLPAMTDLNALPLLPNLPEKVFASAAKNDEGSNWENSFVSQTLSRKCEALAVSGLTEYGDEIDVVAPTDILKQIFKIPYSKARLSVAVHRIGDTLILNTGPDVEEGEKVFRRQSNQSKASDSSIFLNFAMHSVRMEACDCPPSHQPSSANQKSSTILPGHFGHREGPFVSSTNSSASKTQFLDQNASGNRKSPKGNNNEYLWGTKHNKGSDPVKKASQVGGKPKFPVQESDKYGRVGNNGFLRVLFWQFHNFRMLLGSDLLLFSNDKYVAVSLHLWDVSRQVTPLAWLEAWLDNVMASVPELAICYHQNGVVQGYELLKTDDIFLLKGISEDGTPAFHPQVVQQNGLSVLRFLQDNCKQDPGAYWLYKGAGEDVIQLFDLSVIPPKTSSDDHDKGCGSLPSLLNKGRRDSLFSLGTLLYRVAHRLSLSKALDNKMKCAKFFKKCLDFLSEQDHLVVRAYAHEQFARLILNCYEELELASEPYLLESEVTVTDLEDESSELSLEMFALKSQEMGSSNFTESATPKEDKIMETLGSEISGICEVERDAHSPHSVSFSSATEIEESNEVSSRADDSLVTCQFSSSPHITSTIADPISSKLVAIHHVSQAIKSLRWKRQLQNSKGDLIDHANKSHERSSVLNFSFCACGDADCIEVCDIREWLPKTKIDRKMWKLVLLLGESYLSLGEAYFEDGQFIQSMKVVKLACLLYGSMPQHLEDAQFISSMPKNCLSCSRKLKRENKKMNIYTDDDKDLDSELFEDGFSDSQCSPTYWFWAKAWTLVGDVYLEHHMTRGKDIPVQVKTDLLGGVVRMSNEVVKEVKRLKKKLGQYKQNCSTCSLINCSCQNDRASSGNSASSSSGDTQSLYSRKNRKLMMRNSYSHLSHAHDNRNSHTISTASFYEADSVQTYKHSESQAGSMEPSELKESFPADDAIGYDSKGEEANTAEPCTKDSPKARNGGIFKFIEGPKSADIEYNLTVAIECFNAACKAMNQVPIDSAEFQTVLKKRGWVSNELGRRRLERGELVKAENAFADAIKAFNAVSDHTNIILVNCNLGHGRRALAEELVSKMEEFKQYDHFQKAYKQSLRSAKLEYVKSIEYYLAAVTEMNAFSDMIETSLCNEVLTQYAHTYLRYGMLLAKENTLAEGYDSNDTDELPSGERTTEGGKTVMSASDAFREALSTYESLGELRKQEAAFAHFHLACYYRDLCLNFLDLDHKSVKHSKCENKIHQQAKWYASLAEKNWQKSLGFYGPKTHSAMYLTIIVEQAALSQRFSSSFHSNTMLEAALSLFLEGRHVVEVDCSWDEDPAIKEKFWNQLQALLKNMVATSLSRSENKPGAIGEALPGSRAGDAQKLREMYRISLKSTSFCDLHAMHKLWMS